MREYILLALCAAAMFTAPIVGAAIADYGMQPRVIYTGATVSHYEGRR